MQEHTSRPKLRKMTNLGTSVVTTFYAIRDDAVEVCEVEEFHKHRFDFFFRYGL